MRDTMHDRKMTEQRFLNSKIKRLKKEAAAKKAELEQTESKLKTSEAIKKYLHTDDRIEQYNQIKVNAFERKAMNYAKMSIQSAQ